MEKLNHDPALDIEKTFLSQEQIIEICRGLGERITQDYQGKTPILIGLLRGCVPFLSELIKHIHVPVEYDFMEVQSYFGDVKSSHTVTILKDVTTSIEGRHIIIVDDIVDTGLTLKTIIAMLEKRGCLSCEIATLLDKPEGRITCGLNPKYVGTHIPNEFVVGFGLDYQQLYRNLPFIGVLKPEVYQTKK